MFYWLIPIIILVGGIVMARHALTVVIIVGHSMLPTFKDGDRVLVLKHYPLHWLRVGQIVLLCFKKNERLDLYEAFGSEPILKRLVGLAGDAITSCAAGINVCSSSCQMSHCDEHSKNKCIVEDKHIYVCGDNPQSSTDSRILGSMPMSYVKGVVIHKFN